MKVIYNNLIPFKGFAAMNLFGVIFARRDAYITRKTLNHEQIHTMQMREMLYVFFYVWYIVEWLIRLLCCFNSFKAYKNISFEREAKQNEENLNYKNERVHYTWLEYL